MRSLLTLSIIVFFIAFTPMFPKSPVTSNSSVALAALQYNAGNLFSQEQLDNLLAPIALYPDPLLAQVLVAATFPDQIDEAARFLWAKADPKAIDYQPWNVSVKAVAHYPTVLYMMADDLDWTATLGQAYVSQSTDVMMAVQSLRRYARSSGSLVSTAQMAVVEEAGYIMLWPVHPRYLYVPVYDPALVFFNSGYYRTRGLISFSIGFTIGSWLNYDCDWRHHRVTYHGWVSRAGWVHRYRPRIQRTNIYVHNRYTHVAVNRPVLNRWVNTRRLNRYNAVYRRGNDNHARVHRPSIKNRVKRGAINREHRVNKKIIRKNIDPRSPRIDANRGRLQERLDLRIESEKSIKREQVKKRHEHQVNKPVTVPVQRRMARHDTSAFLERQTVIDSRAASWQGRASREQVKQRTAIKRSPERPVNAPSDRRDGGRRSRNNRQR